MARLGRGQPNRPIISRAPEITAAGPEALGRATETDTATAVTATKTYALGLATETDTARPVTAGSRTYSLGRATETDTAFPISASTQSGGVTMPDLFVEVAFSVGASTSTLLHLDDPTRGKLGTGTLGSSATEDPVWVDVTGWVRSGTIRRGSSRVESPIITYDASTLSVVLDNSDRRFDPSNLDGPYVDAVNGVTQVTAMRAVRVHATWNNTDYELFRGYADAWDVSWDVNYSECVLTATDGMKVLAGIDRPAIAAVGAGETTGTRIDRILDSADWPDADRDIASGDSTVQSTTLEGAALAELQLVADTEMGEFYIDAGGRAVFRNRNALLQDTRSNTAQATFGDGGGSELPYVDLGIATDDATFYNDVRVTRAGGAEQQVQDATSQALFYRRTFKPASEPLLQTDADALAYAQALLYVAKDPELRFTDITINPRSDANAMYPHALGREIGDRITVIRRPPGGGDPIEADQFIRGIEHTFEPATWATTWTFQNADRYGSFFTIGDATLGRLDHNALAY